MDKKELENNQLLLDYHQYLLKKSWRGDLYRKFWLYPQINKRLKGKTLDIGCGNGKFLAFRPGSVGIDVNHFNVEFCVKQGFEAYTVSDQWPFENESFDSALLDNVLEHLESPEFLILEAKRVLKPGGRLVMGVPGPAGYAYDSDHKVYYPDEKLRKIIEPLGFKREENFHLPIKSKWLEMNMRQYCYFTVFLKQ